MRLFMLDHDILIDIKVELTRVWPSALSVYAVPVGRVTGAHVGAGAAGADVFGTSWRPWPALVSVLAPVTCGPLLVAGVVLRPATLSTVLYQSETCISTYLGVM